MNTELAASHSAGFSEPALANIGERRNTANTPRRATAISSPIARAISLPRNHLTIVFETVIPAISTPTPKIAKPEKAVMAVVGNSIPKMFVTAAWSIYLSA